MYAYLVERCPDQEAVDELNMRLLEPMPGESPDSVDQSVLDAEMAAFSAVQAML
jgi:hypothetical protein